MPATLESAAVSDILADLPGGQDCTLIVHSSFRAMSHAGLRAVDFAAALLDRLAGGTLLMPTMTWRTVTPQNPVFDELATPSHTGILTEVFRTGLATARSLHPTHSVSAAGPAARALLDGHHLDDTPCSANSPYGRMRAYEAWILLLGVGFETCTAIHHAEELVAPDLYVRPPSDVEFYQCRDRHGELRRVATRRHTKLPRNFPQFAAPLAASGRLRTGTSSATRWQLMRLNDLYDVVFAALAQRRDATALHSTPADAPFSER